MPRLEVDVSEGEEEIRELKKRLNEETRKREELQATVMSMQGDQVHKDLAWLREQVANLQKNSSKI